jgi:hypothetical protein
MSSGFPPPGRQPVRGRVTLAFAAVAVAGIVGTVGCGDDPFKIEWEISPDTVTLWSLTRPELGLPAGFDFLQGEPIRVEQASATGRWDLALSAEGQSLVLLPPGALSIPSRARVARLTGRSFDEVVEAPADTTLYSAVDPVPVEMGSVYVVRTNQRVGSFGTSCVYYAKLAPLTIDPEAGTLRFVYDASPVCNDRALIPRD